MCPGKEGALGHLRALADEVTGQVLGRRGSRDWQPWSSGANAPATDKAYLKCPESRMQAGPGLIYLCQIKSGQREGPGAPAGEGPALFSQAPAPGLGECVAVCLCVGVCLHQCMLVCVSMYV